MSAQELDWSLPADISFNCISKQTNNLPLHVCFLAHEISSHTTQIKDGKGWDWKNEELAMVEEDGLRPSKEPEGAQVHGT